MCGAGLFLEMTPQLASPQAQLALERVLLGAYLGAGAVMGDVVGDCAFDLLKCSRRLLAGDGAWLRWFFYTIIHKTQKCVGLHFLCCKFSLAAILVVRIFFTKRY